MLVLTRRPGQGIKLGKDIHVEVLASGRREVRIGITAPDSVLILRDELPDASGLALQRATDVDHED